MLLNCHTYYSFKYGTIPTDELLKEASERGYSCIALTDINNTSACIDFVRRSGEFGIRPVIGIDFRNGVDQQFVALARSLEGFREMNEFLSGHLHRHEHIPAKAPTFRHCFVVYPFAKAPQTLHENEYAGISVADLKRLPFSPWKQHTEKLVVLHTTTFRNKRDYSTHRLLRAIDNNTLLSKLPLSEQAVFENEQLLSLAEMEKQFEHYPQLISNTNMLLERCHVEFDFTTNKNKRFFTSSEEEDFQLLKKACYNGLAYRYPNPSDAVFDRIDKELKVIREMNFCAYFLINWDLVQYAQRKNYFYVGRGSGANSVLAYLLRITNVDPIELDLYFERFINPYRTSPPDFDIDFSWTDRDDITHYIFNKYGYEYTVLLGTYITYNHKSAFREIGKVFGLPEEEITRLQKNPDPAQTDQYGRWVIQYSKFIEGFPSHCSIHSSGILISETPISYFSATEMLPKGFPSTQFDMQVAEDVGLHKFDILSQRGLSKIKDTVEMVRINRGISVDINNLRLFMHDESVKHLLKRGKAIGCFYVESPAMRMLLTKLKASDYKSLVAASSIIRPGVSQSGMMREYIVRFQNPALRRQAHDALPELYEILEDTYGVMVYQEDVIKVAHYFAGLTLDEADVLRRGMSWKFRQRNEFWKVRDTFYANCEQKGYKEETVANIWRQIESFANYAFAKGHSASYAVESFQALYLKAYFPIEYMTATLNNGGGFYSPHLYLHEARLHGAKIELPCINHSNAENRVEGDTIWLGLGMLYELERETINVLLAEREQNGAFANLQNVIDRVAISIEQLSILIRIGAFRFTGKNKKELLWDIHYKLGHAKKSAPANTLFATEVKEFKLPELFHHELDNAFDEMELLGFPLQSAFDLVEKEQLLPLLASDLPSKLGRVVAISGLLVTRKPTMSSKGQTMYFGTWLDREGMWIDTVHFPPSVKQYPFRGLGIYQIEGKVVEEYGFYTLEVTRMFRMRTKNREDD